MSVMILPSHAGLQAATRLRSPASVGDAARVWEWLFLVSAGVTAALASTFIDFTALSAWASPYLDSKLRIPGHAILRIVFPMAIGLAVVPRRGAGTVMAGSALLTSLSLRMGGFAGDELSLGALTSLTSIGPILDWTLRRSTGGWRLYLDFALAGLAGNLLALFVRGMAKATGFEHAGGRPLVAWIAQASVTYVVCGLVAGLLGGLILFSARRRSDLPAGPDRNEERP